MVTPRGIGNYRRVVGDGRGNSIVAACVRWMSRTFPEAPVQVQERADTGKWQPVARHRMVDLIENPNPFYSGVSLWMATIKDLMISGNAFWLIGSARNGQPTQLWFTPSTLMTPRWDSSGNTFITHYEYRPRYGAEPIRVDVRDVVHLRFELDAETRMGISPLSEVIREVYTDDEAAVFTASLLKNLGIPGVIITPGDSDVEIDEEAAEAAKTDWLNKFGGENRGEPLIMGAPAKVQVLSFSPEQMNLRNLRQIPEERISAALGTPAMIVGLGAGLERSTYNNIAEAREAVYENTILPLHRMIGADLRTQLLTRFEGQTGTVNRRVGFDTSNVRVLQEDRQRLAQEIRVLVASGVITIKDAKHRLNEAGYNLEIDEDTDNVYIRQLSTIEVPPGETRWDYVFGEAAQGGEPDIPSGTTSGPSDGGVGSDGGNLGERVDEAALAPGRVLSKDYHDAVTKRGEASGFYTASVVVAEEMGLHKGFSSLQWGHIKQMGYDADRFIDDAVGVFSEMFQRVSRDVVNAVYSAQVRRLAAVNGAQKQEDWPDLAEAIAEGERSVDEVLEDFNEKYLAPVLILLFGSVANATFRQVATDLGVAIPFRMDSVVGAEVLQEAAKRVRVIDLKRQTRAAVLQAILDAATLGESTEQLALRLADYVEGAHMYPGVAKDKGAAAARLHRARVIAETEVRHIQNFAAAHAMEQSGLVEALYIFDGPGCGWLFHDDPDIANGTVRTFADFRATPLAHPRCVRAASPVMKMALV